MKQETESELRQVVGDDHVLRQDEVPPPAWDTGQPFLGELVLRPGTVEEVSQVLAICNRDAIPVVPMGGVTGLVQGCATKNGDVGLSLERMNQIEEVDPLAQTLSAEAGVTLRAAQQAAEEQGLYFPVDIGARDNCMLGGNVSTNAGGTRVIRYGMMRDSILGLEAVLADGTVVSSMNRYLKNNSGYDLKQLFIGTEGTLGIVTRIIARLDVAPRSHSVGLLAVENYDHVVSLLQHARLQIGARLCGFEVMWDSFYRKATSPEGPQTSPFETRHPFYVLLEATGTDPATDADAFEAALLAAIDSGLAVDGVIANSDRERDSIWAIRHEVEWLVRDAFNFDVSLRIADAGSYVERLEQSIHSQFPEAFVAAFGHLGDNNVHLSILGGEESDVQRHVYETLSPFEGAVSAEHGIGLEKRQYLPVSRSATEIALMARLKQTLDPKGILNPGKVIDSVN